jgi:digeranylgeranylglycerophospholipid reductase
MTGDSFDVVVVGAGPAGSAAAKAAAGTGARTLLLEKHAAIGIPLGCAEAVSLTGLTNVLGEIDSGWVKAPIHAAELHAPDGSRMLLSHPDAGVVLDRKRFDRDLAGRAERAGAQVWVEAPAVGVEQNQTAITAVRVQTPGGERRIEAKVIIAADGIESQVGNWAGLNTRLKLSRCDSAAQYLLAGVDVEEGKLEFYFGHSVAPGGYAWVFPRGEGTANVGLAVAPSLAGGVSARACLSDFVRTRFGARGTKRGFLVGGIPAFCGHRLLRRGNLLLAGDAARLVDSITGAGIANALLSGHLAGTAAARFAGTGDPAALEDYSRQWRRRKGRQMRLYYLAREIFLRMTEADINRVIQGLRQEFEGRVVTHIDAIATIRMILRFHRRLLTLVRHLEW